MGKKLRYEKLRDDVALIEVGGIPPEIDLVGCARLNMVRPLKLGDSILMLMSRRRLGLFLLTVRLKLYECLCSKVEQLSCGQITVHSAECCRIFPTTRDLGLSINRLMTGITSVSKWIVFLRICFRTPQSRCHYKRTLSGWSQSLI